jgi:hypothetical protein
MPRNSRQHRPQAQQPASDPDQQQRAEEYGGPAPDDESWLQEQGYPKLGKSTQSRMTQVEHGPYAGGTQQGDAATDEHAAERPSAG